MHPVLLLVTLVAVLFLISWYMHPILLLVALVAVLFLIRWYKRIPKARQRRLLNRALLIGGGILLFFALIPGELHPLWAALIALIPLVYRAIDLFQTFINRMKAGATPGPTQGRTSEVETAFLRMHLDHDSGEMDGSVLQGRYGGCALRDLELADLLALLDECRADRQSMTVLAAYLDRIHKGWRERRSSPPGASSDGMSEEEARAVFGVGPDATREEIIKAHRRLIQRLHPDRGGSDYLAAQLNTAKDLLLGD